jgi:hypothetical protein
MYRHPALPRVVILLTTVLAVLLPFWLPEHMQHLTVMTARAAETCGLAQPAFCDTFDQPSPVVSRTGQLDPAKWTVAHINGGINTDQAEINTWAATNAMHCKTPISGVLPPNDYFMCGPEFGESMHFMEAINDDGHYLYNDLRILQPFNFTDVTGRMGKLTFDVDAKTSGSHGWWLELAITDQPAPAPHSDGDSSAFPHEGVTLYLWDPCGLVPPGDAGSGGVSVNRIDVIRNHVVTAVLPGGTANGVGLTKTGCVETMPDMRNHFEVRMNQQRLELWGTDHMGGALRQLIVLTGMNLPFSVGYVHFQDTHYNATKACDGCSATQTYHWDNIGFDGPALPTPRHYQVPDALSRKDSSRINLGYLTDFNGLQSGLLNFTGVDLTEATSATLTFNIYANGQGMTYRLNGGLAHTFVGADPGGWSVGAVPVSLSELRRGTNTLQVSTSTRGVVANVDLLVNGPGGPPPPPPAPTRTPTPVPPTNTPVPPTATATATPACK